jgi:Sec-independent protein translocase protein TatA
MVVNLVSRLVVMMVVLAVLLGTKKAHWMVAAMAAEMAELKAARKVV